MEWQPIDTAPKDGTWVFLSGGSRDWAWDDGEEFPPMVVAQFSGNEDGWKFAWYDGGYYGDYQDPTHWMPILPPPEAQPILSSPHQGQHTQG